MWLLTLKTILAATDLGEQSRTPLRTAARLAQLAGAELHLLNVADNPPPDADARLREHFRLVAPHAREPESVRVIPGSPAEIIVEHAERLDADAVILGPHRTAGTGGEMGGTAASVVRSASCPCLVAATELRLPLEHIVAPIDLSDAASGALSVALSWASALRPRGGTAHLTALHVTPHPTSSSTDRAVHAEVERARARAGGAALVEISERVELGSDPIEEILRSAASESVDLLVMGTRGATGAASGLGSVSTAVARSTPCPLLLVPPATWIDQGSGQA